MAPHAQLTREIRKGPSGPKIGAFFDLDQTLLAGFSAGAFIRARLLSGRMGPRDMAESLAGAANFAAGRTGFSGFVTATTAMYRGIAESVLEDLGEEIFEEQLAAQIYPESRALVRAHQQQGHTLAIISSATRYQVDPFARDMDIDHVLCTKLEVRDGAFTGRVVKPTCYGEQKAVAASDLAEELGVELDRSYFYTDSHEDLPLLEAVGYPRPLNPNRRLAAVAAKRGWPTRRFQSRGRPSALDLVRTGLLYSSLAQAVLAGIPAGLLTGSRRQGVNLAMAAWGELGTALSGIQVEVEGEEHLWSHRPAVFLFNHQSGVDMLLLCKLLRRDIIGIAKKEIRANPIFGPLLQLGGTVFIDRMNRPKAIEALKPAVEALGQGLSIVISPEGTRSATARIGRFKKGPFHIAMQGQVPIVPIVFRNALDALPRHGIVIRPATVSVVVHPPISTKGWTRESLDDHIATTRKLFVDTLKG